MISSWLEYVLPGISIIFFTCLIKQFQLKTRVDLALEMSLKACRVIISKDLSDLEKERYMRNTAGAMFKVFGSLFLRTTLAVLLSGSIIFAGIYAEFYNYVELIDALSSIYFIAGSVLLLVITYRIYP